MKNLDFSTPKIMGVLNVTPDSFYSGNRFNKLDEALSATEKMLKQGADIIDVGGMSSRPGSDFVTLEEEKRRVIPVISEIVKEFPECIISVDTFRSEIAQLSIESGAKIINDISAGSLDKRILEVVAKFDVYYVFMHMKGTPKTMQINPEYTDVVADILKFMFNKVRHFKSIGINKLIIDPGFGFGKTIEDNFKLLNNLDVFRILDIPVLVGISRKSMLYKTIKKSPEESLNATSAMHAIALKNAGGGILRVHDVKEAVEIVKLMQKTML